MRDHLLPAGLVLPPNGAHEPEFRAAEREAQEADRGLWAACRKG